MSLFYLPFSFAGYARENHVPQNLERIDSLSSSFYWYGWKIWVHSDSLFFASDLFFFSLEAFRISFLALVFWNFTMRWFCRGLFLFIVLDDLKHVSLRNFLVLYLCFFFPLHRLCFSFSDTPVSQMWIFSTDLCFLKFSLPFSHSLSFLKF